MENIKDGQAFELNPYVIQIDKFVKSLEKLMALFLRLDDKQECFSQDEMERIFDRISGRVCRKCTRREYCMEAQGERVYQMLQEIFAAAETYGAELNVEIKRQLEKKCIHAPRFLKSALEMYQDAKHNLMWNYKMMQSREGCAVQIDSFAQMLRYAARELDASIFEDEHLERKLKSKFSKRGVRMLNSVFFVTKEGRFEIHVTVKTGKGQCVTTKEVCRIISECTGRKMILERDERPILGTEYCTIMCMEGPRYYTLQGIARIGRNCQKISGDSFSMLELPGGRQAVILSDGMGTGIRASKESTMVVETLEELLNSGFLVETALQMLNTTLVMGREEVRFSTIDMSIFDLYSGECEIIKAGASMTFIKRQEKVESIKSENLPIGVLTNLEIERMKRQLMPGDMVVMVTDGVLDALPVGQQESLLQTIIVGTAMTNPKEMAHHILEQVLEYSGEIPMDDMTVIAAGIWSLEK